MAYDLYRGRKSREEGGEKEGSHLPLFAALLVMIIVSMILVYTQLNKSSTQDVAYVSEDDLNFQNNTKIVTGYDWNGFLNNDKSENARIAALLFLANEIDSLDTTFDFVDRSVGFGGLDKSKFPAKLEAADSSKESLLQLINNMKAVQKVFLDNGLQTAQTRINRLAVLEKFLKKQQLPQGEIKYDASYLFATTLGLTVDDYSKLTPLMIVNYNLFLAE